MNNRTQSRVNCALLVFLFWTIALQVIFRIPLEDATQIFLLEQSTLPEVKPIIDRPCDATTTTSTNSLKSVSSKPKVRQWMDSSTMLALRKHMTDAEARGANVPNSRTGIMLQFLRQNNQTMFPLLDTVPVTAKPQPAFKFHGQEKEDKHIYQRFFNENTRKCHTFNDGGLFESGAFRGIDLSNTYFFETHFQLPTILVEASKENWDALDAAVAEHRPLSTVHRAALCPIGDKSVCISSTAKNSATHGVSRHPQSVCQDHVPCFDFDETRRYALVSLDIEGFEWEFLKFRQLQADIVIVEVIQWLRQPHTLMTAVEFVARMADLGYYLYASTEHMVGGKNFVFISKNLAENCFADNIIRPM